MNWHDVHVQVCDTEQPVTTPRFWAWISMVYGLRDKWMVSKASGASGSAEASPSLSSSIHVMSCLALAGQHQVCSTGISRAAEQALT